MADETEVTDDPATWPEWLRADRERAEKATAQVRRRRRLAALSKRHPAELTRDERRELFELATDQLRT